MDDIEADGCGEGNTNDSPRPDDTSTVTRRRGVGFFVLGVVVLLCGGVIAASAIPRFLTMGRTAKLGEVRASLVGIKTAQFSYQASYGSFLPAGPHPRSLDDLSPAPAAWTPGSAFDTLGWAPDGAVRGTYQVEVLPDSTDFIVHGWIDADGDGVPAHFTATRSTHPVRVTPDSVL